MRIFLIILIFGMSPYLANAQTYQVRSGEHSDFSRLVILFGDTPEWQLGRVDGGYELRVAQKDVDYDFSRIFDLIPRDRIAALELLDDSRLFIRLGCECHSDAFEIKQGLVIDVKDGPAGYYARFENTFPPIISITDQLRSSILSQEGTQIEPKFTAFAETSVWDYSRSQRSQFNWDADLLSVDESEVILEASASLDPWPGTLLRPNGIDVDTRLIEMRSALVQQISNAASHGLVTPDLGEIQDSINFINTEDESPESENEINVGHDVDLSPKNILENEQNIRIINSVDRNYEADGQNEVMISDSNCVESKEYDISDWSLGLDFGGVTTQLNMYDDMGKVNLKEVENKIRYYIHFSFGAEAAALIEEHNDEIKDTRKLRILANLMDNREVDTDSYFGGQVYCETKAALWSALAYPFDVERTKEIATDSIISHFSDLPIHLRRHLGARLAERFFEIDDLESVKAIQDAISRAPGNHGDGLKLINASLEIRAGDTARGTEKLEELLTANGELAAEAMIQYLEAEARQENNETLRSLEVAEIMAVEANGTETSVKLRLAQVENYVKSNGHREAVEILFSLKEKDEIGYEVLWNYIGEMYENVLNASLNDNFLELIFHPRLNMDETSLDKDLRRKIVDRLLLLGFPEKAREILSLNGGVLDHASRRLFAKSYLQEARSDLAIGYLAGLSDPMSNELRAKAYEMAGDFEQASIIYSELGDTESHSRMLLKAENWDALVTVGTELQRSAADILQNDTDEVEIAAPSISNSEKAITRSRNTREILQGLIDS